MNRQDAKDAKVGSAALGVIAFRRSVSSRHRTASLPPAPAEVTDKTFPVAGRTPRAAHAHTIAPAKDK